MGLQEVNEGSTEMVRDIAQLVPRAVYTHVPCSKEAFSRLLREARHLQPARKDEFAKAMLEHLKYTEPNGVGLTVVG